MAGSRGSRNSKSEYNSIISLTLDNNDSENKSLVVLQCPHFSFSHKFAFFLQPLVIHILQFLFTNQINETRTGVSGQMRKAETHEHSSQAAFVSFVLSGPVSSTPSHALQLGCDLYAVLMIMSTRNIP